MSTLALLRERRSVRHFTAADPGRERVAEVIEDAAWAPSGGNEQPWEVMALSPRECAGLRERFEQRTWAGRVPKVRTLLEAAAGGPLPMAEVGPRIHARIEADGLVRGAPWALVVHTRPPAPPDPAVLAEAGAWTRAALDSRWHAPASVTAFVSGPLNARVRRDSCVGFVLSLCLAAHARGLGTCIQYGYLAFEDELKETLGIDPQQSLVAVVLLGWPDPESPVNAAAIEGARRRPVPVVWR
ncbi:nitroreductase family protein [Nannocystis sp. RBIL2]|uniref:nitroreductase family protein n=1 Tax=Nannocystis sp. RBIL2 TaxID=2996788 RepID=UPI00226DE950|nr:nitroreductase family protein [Nannocystis sp. RBIL2]MCY1065226.1 nitroreductase family protein [Nannocystis sp. RBIL2]